MRHERGSGIARKVSRSVHEKALVKLGFMSFFIKASVEASKPCPWSTDGSKTRISSKTISMTSASLLERSADWWCRLCATPTKIVRRSQRDIANYATKAREGKLKIEDLTGGTFTISNGGVYGSLLSTPILNPPQSGKFSVCTKIMPRPTAVDGKVKCAR